MASSVAVSVGKMEFLGPMVRVMIAAFKKDPFTRAVMLLENSAPNDHVFTMEQWIRMWTPNITGKLKAGGEIMEAGNWAAAAMWYPPGVKKNAFDRTTSPAPLLEYYDKFEEIKKQVLGERQYWYLNLIGRDPERTEKGVVQALLEPYLEKAKQQGVPAWLESTSTHSRDIYAHFGFRTVRSVVIGKGSLASNGHLVQGGEGLVVYGMIAEPGRENTTS